MTFSHLIHIIIDAHSRLNPKLFIEIFPQNIDKQKTIAFRTKQNTCRIKNIIIAFSLISAIMTRAGYILFLAAVLATGGRVTGEIIDLGHGYRNSTDCWNAMDQFRIFGVVSDPVEGYTMESFTTAEHCGTHLDAPYHFNANGWKLGEIPLKHTVANGNFFSFQ